MRLFKFPLFLSKTMFSDKTKLLIVKRQFDFFLSTRIKRSIAVYNFYKNSRTFQDLLRHLKNNFDSRNRLKLSTIGATGLVAFDWNKERIILDENAKKFMMEFDKIEYLKSQAEFQKSGKPPNNNENENLKDQTVKKDDKIRDGTESWEFYVQRNNMITWRREEEDGHYAYKVYVSYPDITSEDFLFVQTNVDYRKEWDDTAVELQLIDNDEEDTSSQPGSIIYWEMMWPKLFSNRDYVFIRKHFVDRQNNLILIVNKSTKHPVCPPKPGLQRVKEYWSYMVIKPKTTFDQPGLEFILTYYDNPGIKIPKYVTSWVAQHQLPNFIERLYQATLKYSERKAMKWYKKDPGYEYPSDVRLDEHENSNNDMKDNVNGKMSTAETEVEIKICEDKTEEGKSWWRYLLFYNYLY